MKRYNLSIFKLMILAILAVSVIACTTIINQALWQIKKGSSTEDVIKALENNRGFTSIEEIEDKTVHQITSDKWLKDGKYEVIIVKKLQSADKQYHIYAFKDNKLIYWGTPLEFAGHDSELINEIGIQAVKIIPED